MVRTSLKLSILLIMACSTLSFSQTSGKLANRAMQSLSKGKYSSAQRGYHNAFKAALKEGDEHSQTRILSNLCQLYLDQLFIQDADSIISIMNKNIVDSMSYQGLLSRSAFASQEYSSFDMHHEALDAKSPSKFNFLFWDQLNSILKGNALSEDLLKKFDGEGMKQMLLGFESARLELWQDAINQWERSLSNAREANKFALIVDLLWYQAWAYEELGDTKMRDLRLEDSYQSAAELGLPLPMLRAGKKWLQNHSDKILQNKLNNIEKTLKSSIFPKLLNFPKF